MARPGNGWRIQIGYLSILLVGWLVWFGSAPRLTDEEQVRRVVDAFLDADEDQEWDAWWGLLSEEYRREYLARFFREFDAGDWHADSARSSLAGPADVLRHLLKKRGISEDEFSRLPPGEIHLLIREAEEIAGLSTGPTPGPSARGTFRRILDIFRPDSGRPRVVSVAIDGPWGLAGVDLSHRMHARWVDVGTRNPTFACVRERRGWKLRWPDHDPMECPPLWITRQIQREAILVPFEFQVFRHRYQKDVGWVVSVGPDAVDLEQARLLDRAMSRQKGRLAGHTILLEIDEGATWESVNRVLIAIAYQFCTEFVAIRSGDHAPPAGIRINGIPVGEIRFDTVLPPIEEQPALDGLWTAWPQKFPEWD